jgi:hypothetical protein
MSPVFKTIITISIWVLFIKGLIASVVGCVLTGIAIMGGNTPLMVYAAISCVGIASLILACVAVKLRKIAD